VDFRDVRSEDRIGSVLHSVARSVVSVAESEFVIRRLCSHIAKCRGLLRVWFDVLKFSWFSSVPLSAFK